MAWTFTSAWVLAAYLVLGRWLVRCRVPGRDIVFALVNLATVYYFYFSESAGYRCFTLYVILATFQYLIMRWGNGESDSLFWLAFLTPIGIFAALRYVPLSALTGLSAQLRSKLVREPDFTFASLFIGLSYFVFRTSHLVLEVRNSITPRPSLWQYLSFAFFLPTLAVGPINPYHRHERAFEGVERTSIPIGSALLRVLVGAVKYRFIAGLVDQLGYSKLLLDGYPHLWIDLPVASIAYYLYLYCNFSGFCDIAIGCAGLMGISVAENFDSPFAARNLKDFWNRWHITLSQYMRDVVFSPLSKTLVRAFGPSQANQAIALTILVVFLIVGVWHGVGWHYLAFGAAHALGVIVTHYYTIFLKRFLGKDHFAAYNRSRMIEAIAISVTFMYVAATLFLFANDWDTMKNIFSVLQHS